MISRPDRAVQRGREGEREVGARLPNSPPFCPSSEASTRAHVSGRSVGSPSDRWDRTTLAKDGGMSSNGISSSSISATGTLRRDARVRRVRPEGRAWSYVDLDICLKEVLPEPTGAVHTVHGSAPRPWRHARPPSERHSMWFDCERAPRHRPPSLSLDSSASSNFDGQSPSVIAIQNVLSHSHLDSASTLRGTGQSFSPVITAAVADNRPLFRAAVHWLAAEAVCTHADAGGHSTQPAH